MHRLPRAIRLRQQHAVPHRYSNRISPRRLASKFIHPQNGEAVRYQSVRIKGPGITMRRVATIGLYVSAAYAYYTTVTWYLNIEVEVLDEMLEEEEVQEEGEEDDEGFEYTREDSTFIPLTWAQKMPRTYYRGSDPEWQEFVKFSKDKKGREKIQNELVGIVFSGSQKYPLVGKLLGNEAKVGKYWLNVFFPDGPPQEYERSGIEIADEYVAWSKQRVSPEDHWRLMRALYPKATFESLWATTKVLAGMQYRRMMECFGWEVKDPSNPEERYRQAMDLIHKQHQVREPKEVGKAQLEPDGSPRTVASAPTASEAQHSNSSDGDAKRLPWQFPVPLPTNPATSDSANFPIAMMVFQSTLRKYWNPSKREPPRGTFIVSGMVELRGKRGCMLFDVHSFYDPKAGKYVAMEARMRNYMKWNQTPRGGP